MPPSLRQPLASGRWSLSRLFALSGALLLLCAWLAVGFFLRSERTAALEATGRENANLATSLQESTLRVLSTVDQATRRLSHVVAAGEYDSEKIVRYASETGLVPNILVQLTLVGADGRTVGSNLDPDGSRSGRPDLSEREHIRAHLAPQSVEASAQALFADGLFIGKPVLGKVSGRWTIQLSRRISAPDGRALGVVVASLDPKYFESVYAGIDLGEQGVATLVGADRTVRARAAGGKPAGLGSLLDPESPIFRPGAPNRGDYRRASGVDQVDRVFAYRQVQGFPLYVVVGVDLDRALAEWRAMATMAVSLMGLLTAVTAVGLVMFGRGVRRLEASNRELAISEAKAKAASQAKSEFLSAVSHELRTPLTSIRGFAELMERRLEQPKFRDQAAIIRRSAEHLNTVLSDILDFAKVEAGAMHVRRAPVSLRPLIHSTAEVFRVTAAAKGLELCVEVDEQVPEALVTDELRLRQVLNNLLSNALKFTAQGTVKVSADCDGGRLNIRVSDTGPGIPAELHEVVFERFRQASAQVANDHGGTGLGLTLSRELTRLMGGTLTLDSAAGQGARFTVSLPLPSAPAPAPAP